ncbi:hypothetical protein WICPIJ_002666 [Wickerhamomyces pijperi]|uniref:Uncharacterized protein n=1 Tax=Wickerhamomyces pijperi TaxID=599730 RepID=A0A9P8QBA3_WICPI|nr:hypothetical protein WICPIJ_002666 [Wickerhamomyces pijperi]
MVQVTLLEDLLDLLSVVFGTGDTESQRQSLLTVLLEILEFSFIWDDVLRSVVRFPFGVFSGDLSPAVFVFVPVTSLAGSTSKVLLGHCDVCIS